MKSNRTVKKALQLHFTEGFYLFYEQPSYVQLLSCTVVS